MKKVWFFLQGLLEPQVCVHCLRLAGSVPSFLHHLLTMHAFIKFNFQSASNLACICNSDEYRRSFWTWFVLISVCPGTVAIHILDKDGVRYHEITVPAPGFSMLLGFIPTPPFCRGPHSKRIPFNNCLPYCLPNVTCIIIASLYNNVASHVQELHSP